MFLYAFIPAAVDTTGIYNPCCNIFDTAPADEDENSIESLNPSTNAIVCQNVQRFNETKQAILY